MIVGMLSLYPIALYATQRGCAIIFDPGGPSSLCFIHPSQVIVGFVRPKTGATIRKGWNHLHHWLGRLTMVSAWVTLYMGIYMAHESLTYQSSYAYWLAPCISVIGALILTDICLTAYTIFWATDKGGANVAIGGVPPVQVVIEEDADRKLTRLESLERIRSEKTATLGKRAALLNAYTNAHASDADSLRPQASVERSLGPE